MPQYIIVHISSSFRLFTRGLIVNTAISAVLRNYLVIRHSLTEPFLPLYRNFLPPTAYFPKKSPSSNLVTPCDNSATNDKNRNRFLNASNALYSKSNPCAIIPVRQKKWPLPNGCNKMIAFTKNRLPEIPEQSRNIPIYTN